MPSHLLKYNEEGEPVGINIFEVKNWVIRTTPYHTDLEPYLLVHFRAKTAFLEELAKHSTVWQIIVWTVDVVEALIYLEKIIDCILEADETTYDCSLELHPIGESCPNRINIVLPEPEPRQQ